MKKYLNKVIKGTISVINNSCYLLDGPRQIRLEEEQIELGHRRSPWRQNQTQISKRSSRMCLSKTSTLVRTIKRRRTQRMLAYKNGSSRCSTLSKRIRICSWKMKTWTRRSRLIRTLSRICSKATRSLTPNLNIPWRRWLKKMSYGRRESRHWLVSGIACRPNS